MKKILLSIIAILCLAIVAVLGYNMINRNSKEPVVAEQTMTPIPEATVSENLARTLDIMTVEDSLVGDVCSVWNVNYKLTGKLTDTSSIDMGKVYYEDADKKTQQFQVTQSYTDEDMQTVLSDFSLGDVSKYAMLAGTTASAESTEVATYDINGESYTLMYVPGESKYYSVIPGEDTSYFVASCNNPFMVTVEPATFKFETADVDPLTQHTYSMYERTAIEATKKELEEKGTTGSNPVSTATSSATSTYSNANADTVRADLVAMCNQKYDSTGHSTTTDKTVDYTSTTITRSRWILENQTAYVYELSDLSITALSATRAVDGSNFTIYGTITNKSTEVRPFVIVVQYLDKNGNLLGVSCVDKRTEKLQPNAEYKFQATIDKATAVDISAIHSVQFYMY